MGDQQIMTSFLDRLLQLIPEVSYDLIGRILPGGIVVAATAVSLDVRTRGINIGPEPGALELILFVVFAYAAGLAISTFDHVIHFFSWFAIFPILGCSQVSARLTADLRTVTKDQNLSLNWCPLSGSTALGLAHDFIKQNAIERPVVTKLFAEVSLLYGLAIAAAIACSIAATWGTYWLVPVAFLLAGLLRSLRTWYRHQSILNAIVNAKTQAS